MIKIFSAEAAKMAYDESRAMQRAEEAWLTPPWEKKPEHMESCPLFEDHECTPKCDHDGDECICPSPGELRAEREEARRDAREDT